MNDSNDKPFAGTDSDPVDQNNLDPQQEADALSKKNEEAQESSLDAHNGDKLDVDSDEDEDDSDSDYADY